MLLVFERCGAPQPCPTAKEEEEEEIRMSLRPLPVTVAILLVLLRLFDFPWPNRGMCSQGVVVSTLLLCAKTQKLLLFVTLGFRLAKRS